MATREIDEKILSEIEKTGIVRRKDLLEALKERYAKEKGFSTTSLNRRIGELIDEGKVKVIESDEFEEYGISDEDKRAKYLAVTSYIVKKKLIDNLITRASEGDSFENRLIFKEINRNIDSYSLNSLQLSRMANFLGHDEDTDQLVIKIIHKSVLKPRHCIAEAERESLTESLARLINKYRLPQGNEKKKHIFDILGFFSDESVIWGLQEDLKILVENKELLSKDAPAIWISSGIKDVYQSKYLIHTFEELKEDLLQLMWEYNEKGKEKGHEDERKIALVLDNILDYAVENRDKAIYYEKLCGARK